MYKLHKLYNVEQMLGKSKKQETKYNCYDSNYLKFKYKKNYKNDFWIIINYKEKHGNGTHKVQGHASFFDGGGNDGRF